MAFSPDFKAHLETGATTIARAWEVIRTDGLRMGFTDHDRDLWFEGLSFRADGGLSARALATSTGLAVDNGEALGALSDAGIAEEDIRAGRFDGAIVKAWLVNWVNPVDRALRFRGSIGEIIKSGGAFRAELRGLTEALNAPNGRIYQSPCAAVLGDSACGVDLDEAAYSTEVAIATVVSQNELVLPVLPAFSDGWFAFGKVEILSGLAIGLTRSIKTDRPGVGVRTIELWDGLTAAVVAGDLIRLRAGCDKGAETCKAKFANFLNFRGFPHIPGEDWMMAYPRRDGQNDGGSLMP